MITTVQRLATGRRVAAGWLAFFLYALVVFPLFDRINGMPEAARPLDLRVLYAPTDVEALFTSLGADGRLAYVRSLLIADVVWPAVYGTVLALTIAWGLAGRSQRHRRWAIGLPIVAVVLDLLENASIAVHLLLFPPLRTWLAWASSGVTSIKWVAASAATVAAIVALAVRFWGRGDPEPDAGAGDAGVNLRS